MTKNRTEAMSYSPEITKLIAEGSRYYSAKDYDAACEKYAEVCELYSSEHGEENADLLLMYGKALFQNAVSKSDVFGATKTDNAEEKKEDEKDEENEEGDNFQFYDAAPVAEEDDEGNNEEEDNNKEVEEEDERKEEADANEDNDNAEGEGEGEEAEQSDFEIAWEILDLTRALFENQTKEKEELSKGLEKPYLKNNEETSNEYIIALKKLSETYDLLGEVSLEAGNFSQAVLDFQSSLDLRLQLYDSKASSLISESHYKLSLALEFSVDDPKSREKAAEQMKLAIESVQHRNANETDEEKKKENEELIKDLEVRYQDLKKDPSEEIQLEQINMIKGLLGEVTQESGSNPAAAIAASVNDLTSAVKRKAPVNDLSGMIKKKKPAKDKK